VVKGVAAVVLPSTMKAIPVDADADVDAEADLTRFLPFPATGTTSGVTRRLRSTTAWVLLAEPLPVLVTDAVVAVALVAKVATIAEDTLGVRGTDEKEKVLVVLLESI
jgi:hypothetical protein